MLYRGTYPEDMLALYQQDLPDGDLAGGQPDFLGVNFYAQAHVRADAEGAFGIATVNPDAVPACNGPVRPQALHDLLLRLRAEYGDPVMMITENGAGFIGHDDTPSNGVVADTLRSDYITRHVDAVLAAQARGYAGGGLFPLEPVR